MLLTSANTSSNRICSIYSIKKLNRNSYSISHRRKLISIFSTDGDSISREWPGAKLISLKMYKAP